MRCYAVHLCLRAQNETVCADIEKHALHVFRHHVVALAQNGTGTRHFDERGNAAARDLFSPKPFRRITQGTEHK